MGSKTGAATGDDPRVALKVNIMNSRFISEGLLNHPQTGVIVCNSVGRITEANSAFCALTGYDITELTNMSCEGIYHQDDREVEKSSRHSLVHGSENHTSSRKRYLTKSGNTVWGDTYSSVVRDQSGDCEALVTYITDATEKRLHEILLKGQTRVLDKLYHNSSLEDICTTIVETIETVENGLLCSILKLNQATRTLHKVAAPSLPDFYNDAVEGMKIGCKVGSCGAAAFHEQRVIVKDILNHPNWQKARRLIQRTNLRSCWSQPILGNDGRVLGTFAIYYTEPREPGPFELRLIDSAAELAALAINHKEAMSALQISNDLKREFISTAAHEMKMPLTSIMGYAELLRYAKDQQLSLPEDSDEFLDKIVKKTEMLSRIIGDLFDISKIENGYSMELEKKPVEILKTVNSVINNFKRISPGHSFQLEVMNELPERVYLDEDRIVQVLNNLVGNAVKYSPNGGQIHLVASAKHNMLQFSITDHGVGMSEQQLERVFDKFYRANDSVPSAKGLGLGMSIAREIVEAHGGEIKIRSTKGSGTRVHFTVPTLAPESAL